MIRDKGKINEKYGKKKDNWNRRIYYMRMKESGLRILRCEEIKKLSRENKKELWKCKGEKIRRKR